MSTEKKSGAEMTAKEKVLGVWPDAAVWEGPSYFAKYRITSMKNDELAGFFHSPLGFGATEEAAWQNAAKSLPASEGFCEKCGRLNCVWFTANEIWNLLGRSGIMCPVCFIEEVETKGINKEAWTVVPEGYISQGASSSISTEQTFEEWQVENPPLGGFVYYGADLWNRERMVWNAAKGLK